VLEEEGDSAGLLRILVFVSLYSSPINMVLQTFMPSRRRPAAVGKPSFAYFSVDYLLDDVCRPDEPTDFPDLFLPDATPYERSEDHGPIRLNLWHRAVRLASTEMDFFDIVLAGNQFWPRRRYLSNEPEQWQIRSSSNERLACRGLGAVNNVTSMEPVATEVGCGIELSPCSAACPSDIYTSFWPDICAGLHSGTSAAPLLVGLPLEFGFTAQTTPLLG
ncbi:hypothetical protein THAOC_19238, partial [Thalassiosira oceanica]